LSCRFLAVFFYILNRRFMVSLRHFDHFSTTRRRMRKHSACVMM